MGAVKIVQLKKRHTHNGIEYQPGYFLTLEVRVAAWLIDQGVAVESRAAPVRQAPPPKMIKRGCCGGRW